MPRVRQADQQFLSPDSFSGGNDPFAESLGQQSPFSSGQGARLRSTLLRRLGPGVRPGNAQARLQLSGAARIAAGQELGAQVGERLSSFGGDLADLSAQNLGAQSLVGTQAGREQLLNADLSRFGSFFQNIGLIDGPGDIQVPGQTQIAGGLFSPGQLFGRGRQINF